jgi:cytochrome c553
MPNRLFSALLAAALASSFAVLAQDKKTPSQRAAKKEVQPDKDASQQVAHGARMENQHAICIGCHGIPGYKTAFPEVYHVPKIAGQQQAYIISALKAYKSGARSHPSMRGVVASLSEEDMAALAAYYGAPAK